ncbi:hypothetical protein ABEU97_20555 [Priestia megaterium]
MTNLNEMMKEAMETSNKMDKVVAGVKDMIQLTEELETFTAKPEEHVLEGMLAVVALETVTKTVDTLLGELMATQDYIVLKMLSDEIKQAIQGKEEYFVTALMLAGVELGGIL